MNLRTREVNSRSSNSRERANRKAIVSDSCQSVVHSALKGTEDTGHTNKTQGQALGPRWTFPLIATGLNFKNWYGHTEVYYLIFM